MPDRSFNILSTSSLPLERMNDTPAAVNLRVIPFTEIFPRRDENILLQIKKLSAEKQTVVFTSAHAVKFVAGMAKNKPEWKIYCIRNETRIAVINWFGSESIVNFASNANILSQCMIADGVKEAVFFCGDQRMDILPDNLRKAGVELNECVVYDTVLTPVLLDYIPDAILFFSPTAVRSFFSANALSTSSRVFAMGKTTAQSLREFTSQPIIISPEADKVFVFNMAVDYAASNTIS